MSKTTASQQVVQLRPPLSRKGPYINSYSSPLVDAPAFLDAMWPPLYRHKGIRRTQRSLCCQTGFDAGGEADEGMSDGQTDDVDARPVPRLQLLLLLC